MNVVTTIKDIQHEISAFRQNAGGREIDTAVGLVPTMGYLHEGHASLIREARQRCGYVVVSIFVNPLQFGPNEDFDRYPRDPERDRLLAEQSGADLIFMPEVKEMYPKPIRTTVSVSEVSSRMCGASRPGHFDGVSTVVMKLFQIVQPNYAFFGMKDAQQIAVVEQMILDLNVPVQVIRCPTIRESDGLAKSSRNVYLNPEERVQAVSLGDALSSVDNRLRRNPNMTIGELQEQVIDRIQREPLARIDYVEIAAYPSLEPLSCTSKASQLSGTIIIALAVFFGKTRLIDNRILTAEEVRSLVSYNDEI